MPGGRLLAALRGHTARRSTPVTLSADGKLLMSGRDDGTIELWNMAEGPALVGFEMRLLAALQGQGGGVLGLALGGEGRLAVSAGFERHDQRSGTWIAGGRGRQSRARRARCGALR